MGKTWYFLAALLIAVLTGFVSPYIARECPKISLWHFAVVHALVIGVALAPMLTLKGHHFR